MSISDELMWRYYELLTDHPMDYIAQLKQSNRPMEAKKDLAAQIVRDFHGGDAALRAADDWMRQFQMKEAPRQLEQARVSIADIGVQDGNGNFKKTEDGIRLIVRLDKMLARAGFGSVSECMRKIKEGAVQLNGATTRDQFVAVTSNLPAIVVLRLGRKIREVEIHP